MLLLVTQTYKGIYMFIYSTCSADVKFNIFKDIKKGDVPRAAGCVVIAGKANVANKNLVTPKGVVTEISEDDYALLKNNAAFIKMEKACHMKADKIKEDGDKMAAKDMAAKDGAAPLTKAKVEEGGVVVKDDSETAVG